MTIRIRKQGAASLKAGINAKSRQRRERLRSEVSLRALPMTMGRNDRQPELVLVERRIDEVRPANRRVRRSNAAHVASVMRSIESFGNCVPILIDGSGTIIDGSIRLDAANRLGHETIPCVVIDHLSAEQVRLLSIALNRLAESGEWDLEVLELELVDLKGAGIDISLSGFNDIELDVIMQPEVALGAASNADEPEPHETALSRLGDLWLLGTHRLICGDAISRETYDALMGSERAHMSFSDPPYNVPIAGFVSGLGKKKHADFAMACGEMSEEQFRAFLTTYLDCSREFSVPGAVIFGCMDWRHSHDMVEAARQAKLNFIQMCVWDKGSGAMGSLYRNAYELVHVFCSGSKPRLNNIELGRSGRDRTNVHCYPGAARRGSSAAQALKFHATPKPIELVEDYMLDVSARGEIVLDAFMGSGTTIIAAERCGRQARGIELEPKFVDVAVRRWQDLTGEQAIHAESGRTFDEISEDRAASE
jgi:DNA modification methylase